MGHDGSYGSQASRKPVGKPARQNRLVQELTAVVKTWQKGAMSRDTLFELLRRGEILPEGRTNEEEARLVGAEKPTPSQTPTGNRPIPAQDLQTGQAQIA